MATRYPLSTSVAAKTKEMRPLSPRATTKDGLAPEEDGVYNARHLVRDREILKCRKSSTHVKSLPPLIRRPLF